MFLKRILTNISVPSDLGKEHTIPLSFVSLGILPDFEEMEKERRDGRGSATLIQTMQVHVSIVSSIYAILYNSRVCFEETRNARGQRPTSADVDDHANSPKISHRANET